MHPAIIATLAIEHQRALRAESEQLRLARAAQRPSPLPKRPSTTGPRQIPQPEPR